jgi:hypothetical protein
VSREADAKSVLTMMQAFYAKQTTPESAAMADVLLYAISAIDTIAAIELAVTRFHNFWLPVPGAKG